ncbi:uncharacterized protein LOC144868683 [Branchiostoma floridae x Branchiostoma japonicum]
MQPKSPPPFCKWRASYPNNTDENGHVFVTNAASVVNTMSYRVEESTLQAFVAILCLSLGQGRVYINENTWIVQGYNNLNKALQDRSFGFLEGGTVEYNLTCTRPAVLDLWLLSCNTSEAKEYARLTASQLDWDCNALRGLMARDPDNSYCKRDKIKYNESHPNRFHIRRQMKDSRFYTFFLLQCPSHQSKNQSNRRIGCRSELTLLNPDGEHLSSDEIPLPWIFVVLNIMWSTMATLWLINWVKYHRFSNNLHKFITVVPICKIVLVFVVMVRWHQLSKDGIESKPMQTLRYFLESVEDAMLFMAMMVISEGWGVVRYQVRHFRWTVLAAMFVVFAGSRMCVHWVHNYFLAFAVCCVVFVMYRALKWCSYNMEVLRRRQAKTFNYIRRLNLEYKTEITLHDQIHKKFELYNNFRMVSAAFSMLYAIVVTLGTFLSEFTWVQVLTFEVPELLVYLAIGIIFRLQDFGKYDNVEMISHQENYAAVVLPEVLQTGKRLRLMLGHYDQDNKDESKQDRTRSPQRFLQSYLSALAL